MTDRTKDSYTLLCNQCGYIIEGLHNDDPCPECGLAIMSSLPHDRPGTPWQIKNSIFSLLRTWLTVIFRPSKSIEDMMLIKAASNGVAACTPILSSTITLLALLIIFKIAGITDITGVVIVLVIFLGLIYWVSSNIYARLAVARIKLISKKRGYKIDHEISWSIVEHASCYSILFPIGIIASILTLIGYDFLRNQGLLNTTSTTDSLFTLVFYLFCFGSVPISIACFEFYLSRATKKLRYYNRLLRPLMSCDPPQLITKSNSGSGSDSIIMP